MKNPRILGVIPARYASSRFPGKPLFDLAGKPMIQRVYEQARQAGCLTDVVVATDDKRIFDAVKAFGGAVEMTRSTHLSGTDRVGEIAARMPGYDCLINIQGDEPLIDPRQIDAVGSLLAQPAVAIATLVRKLEDEASIQNPNVVKAVLDQNGKALYFSRASIPYPRSAEKADYYQHVGIYGYRSATLLELVQLPPAPLEQAESLEQLRWLYHGYSIHTAITTLPSIGVDTPEDAEGVIRKLGN